MILLKSPGLLFNGQTFPFLDNDATIRAMTFADLVHAVAFEGKPIGVVSLYQDERKAFDEILCTHGLAKFDDTDQIRVWFFKPKNREEAIRRINEVNKVDAGKRKRGYYTIDDHRAKGWAFGYFAADIEDFLLRRTVMILRCYAATGRVQFSDPPHRMALPWSSL